ncbi:hypothetical protein, partial [Marinobacter sp.]|uniref:hypothetical protein n=1 Tax=Marinobacter sp. TaxID=50741 RepID=UPI0035697CDA
AQDKTQFSTSHCPDISYLKYLGQRPHELLGQLFKERLSVSLLNQGGAFYFVSPPCQPFIFRRFRLRKQPKNSSAYC